MKSQRFRFALGTRVHIGRHVRTIVKRYMRRPLVEGQRWRDVYWVDKPAFGADYFDGGDLERVQ